MVTDALESHRAAQRRRLHRIATCLVVSLSVLNVASMYSGNRLMVYLTKPAAMLAIMLVASNRAAAGWSRYSRLIFVGLACSLIGDILLMLPSDQFVAGLASFLIAHIFYIAAFRSGIREFSRIWLALPFYGTGAVIFWILLPSLGDMKFPVLAYLIVILTMAWQSVHRWLATRNRRCLYAVAGALLFVISDSLIAYSRFRAGFYLADALIMTTYFAAQWLIALSI